MGRAGDLNLERGLGELLTDHRSVRAFDQRPVDRRLLLSAFEGARWAPSSRNSQPWEYIVASRDGEPDLHERIAGLLGPRNRRYAPRAPVLGISLARLRDADGSELEHALHDCGIALGFLILQARSLGLGVHPMAGFDRARARTELGIPDDREPIVALALGYAGQPGDLPDGLGDRDLADRVRKPLSELLFEPGTPTGGEG